MSNGGVEFIRNEMDWDTHDAWGSVQSARFDVAEALWHFTGYAEWGYQPSILLSRGEIEEGSRVERLFGAMREGIVNYYDADYWQDVLSRMRGLVILAGRDY